MSKTQNLQNLSFILAGFFNKSDVEQKKSDHEQREKKTSSEIDINEIHRFAFSSSAKAMSIDNVARRISDVNTRIPQRVERSENLGEINAAPIQPAERLVKSPERTLSWESVSSILERINFYD